MVKFSFTHFNSVWINSFVVFFSLRSWEYFWKKTEKENKNIHFPGSVMTLLFIITLLHSLYKENLQMPNYLSRKILTMGKISFQPIFNVIPILLMLKSEIYPGIATRSVLERDMAVPLLWVRGTYPYSPPI